MLSQYQSSLINLAPFEILKIYMKAINRIEDNRQYEIYLLALSSGKVKDGYRDFKEKNIRRSQKEVLKTEEQEIMELVESITGSEFNFKKE